LEPNCNGCRGGVSKMAELLHLFAEYGLTGVISTTPPTAPVILLSPLFVGLTPGQVGLYQINVLLPSAFPAAVVPCTTLAVGTGNPAYPPAIVQSNLTIDIGGVTSFDGAAICIQPPQ